MSVSISDRQGRETRHRLRSIVFLVVALPLWILLLRQSVETSWDFTKRVFSPARVQRYEPLRSALRGVAQADLFAGYDNPDRQRRVFWRAQYALAPTVLSERSDRATVRRRARRADPHVIVVEFGSPEAFTRFSKRYTRRATRLGRVTRVWDLGNGIGLVESNGGS